MAVLFVTSARFAEHDTGPGHPERPARLDAVLAGAGAAGVSEALVLAPPVPATRADLERVHSAELLERVEVFCGTGGGWLDPDTHASPASWHAALEAAGAGLTAVRALEAGEVANAFCAVRPPGHHAMPDKSMGFCLFNNVAVTAAALADRGERVLILDWDVHHGNGTQAAFESDPRVAYVSFHEWPHYPYTGRATEIGTGQAVGTVRNLPFPSRTTGDVFLAALDEVVAPFAEAFRPTWLLVSAGFDAHRADPLGGLCLTAGDYALVMARTLALVAPGRCVTFLEGGYDLRALGLSAGAAVAALTGEQWIPSDERPSSGGPGYPVVEHAVADLHRIDFAS